MTPVGGQNSQQVDVRIIAATHRDLPPAVVEGTFRKDLYYRLNVLTIELPPLRERVSDVLILAEHFLRQTSSSPKSLSTSAAELLVKYRWPGNVRELENRIRAAALTARSGVIEGSELPLVEREPSEPVAQAADTDFHSVIAAVEKRLLQNALDRSRGNRAEAARFLKIHRQLLYAKLKEHGLEEDSQ